MKYDKEVDKLLVELSYPPGISGGFLPGISSTDPEDIEAWQKNQEKGIKEIPGALYTIAKILDPTGVLTIPDLIYMVRETSKNPSKANIFFTVICLICIIPGLSYYGKALRAGIGSLKIALVASKFNIAVNFILGGTLEGASYILNKLPEDVQLRVMNFLGLAENYTEEDILEAINKYKPPVNK